MAALNSFFTSTVVDEELRLELENKQDFYAPVKNMVSTIRKL